MRSQIPERASPPLQTKRTTQNERNPAWNDCGNCEVNDERRSEREKGKESA